MKTIRKLYNSNRSIILIFNIITSVDFAPYNMKLYSNYIVIYLSLKYRSYTELQKYDLIYAIYPQQLLGMYKPIVYLKAE